MRSHVAEECKNDYAAQLQKFNKEQNQFYFGDMPQIFNVSRRPVEPRCSIGAFKTWKNMTNACTVHGSTHVAC